MYKKKNLFQLDLKKKIFKNSKNKFVTDLFEKIVNKDKEIISNYSNYLTTQNKIVNQEYTNSLRNYFSNKNNTIENLEKRKNIIENIIKNFIIKKKNNFKKNNINKNFINSFDKLYGNNNIKHIKIKKIKVKNSKFKKFSKSFIKNKIINLNVNNNKKNYFNKIKILRKKNKIKQKKKKREIPGFYLSVINEKKQKKKIKNRFNKKMIIKIPNKIKYLKMINKRKNKKIIKKLPLNFIRRKIKLKINRNNNQTEKINKYLNYFKFNVDNKSIYNTNNTAFIHYQSLGRNTFITVLFNNRLIYNKSIGHIKVNNVNICKKEKRRKKNIFTFAQEFTKYFFDEMVPKYEIKNIKIYYNALAENVYALKKHFMYNLYGRILKKNKIDRKILKFRRIGKIFKERNIINYRKYLIYDKRREQNYKNKFYKNKKNKNKVYCYIPKPFKYKKTSLETHKRAYINYWVSKTIYSKHMVHIKSIGFLNKYAYNGCKHKKKKKI